MTRPPEGLFDRLREILPGFTLLDEGVTVGGDLAAQVRVDWVGRTAEGELAAIRHIPAADAQTLTELLDLLALLRSHGSLLARHVGGGNPSRPPKVVLIVDALDEQAARRLSVLEGDDLRVLEVRAIQSRRRSCTYLVPRLSGGTPLPTQAIEERLSELDLVLRRRVDALSDRLRRVDEELTVAALEEGLEWRWRGRPICSVSLGDGTPEVTVAGRETRGLGDDDSIEGILDLAIARWLEVSEESEGLDETARMPRPLQPPRAPRD